MACVIHSLNPAKLFLYGPELEEFSCYLSIFPHVLVDVEFLLCLFYIKKKHEYTLTNPVYDDKIKVCNLYVINK